MELTPDHLRAAQACGCALLPATDAQVQRLSMQRRIFRIDGRPFVATRDGGGFFEAHATLLLLIGGQAPGRERGSKKTPAARGRVQAVGAAEAPAGNPWDVLPPRVESFRACETPSTWNPLP